MQTNLFELEEVNNLSIEAASLVASVSTATIRNWIKTGYLTQSGKGLITKASLDHFIKNVAGTEKLNSRANKKHKDEHDHKDISKKINDLLTQYPAEKVGDEYEHLLADSYRNKEGIYYTSPEIVSDMLNKVQITPQSKFLDPCCGSGNFIIAAIRSGISPENVFGFDTDENAVSIIKKRIRDEFNIETKNIKVGDFFEEAIILKNQSVKFDLIFTNPPWGKKLEKSEKENLARIFNCGNSNDTSSLFMGASLDLLKKDGFLGFLVQEAFFNIATFEDVRSRILDKDILHLIDYGKAFQGLITKAQTIIVKNTPPAENNTTCNLEGVTFNRAQESFKKNPKKIFNFWADEDDSKVINRLYATNHKTLLGNAKWALGIVTGNNARFCKSEPSEGYLPIYKGLDINKNGLKEATTFITRDFSSCQQVAPIEMYEAKEKIIYKFITSKLCFFYDDKGRYILNSANLLIPDIGIQPSQLTDLLNSEIMNWLFQKLFNTHKILRGDLEVLPIHVDYFKNHSDFNEQDYLNYLNIKKSADGTYRVKR
ncbi:MAG: N-6 DNA methylase [Bdellovibrionales bacterium]|nr:N-6 DNA methylase [Bdellovibrionales bacterium]